MAVSRRNRETSEPAVRAIADQVLATVDDIGRRMATRYRAEILDYAALAEGTLYGDVAAISVLNTQALLAAVRTGRPIDAPVLAEVRKSAVRRVHQGITLEALLHAYRLWGQAVWDAVMAAADPEVRQQREAALRIAGRVLEHVNTVSTVVAQAYLDEARGVWSDREVVRRDVLEAMLAGKVLSDRVRRQAATLNLDLRDSFVVLLVARAEPTPEEVGARPASIRNALRQGVEAIKTRLLPASGSLLVGLRNEEIVALYPVEAGAQVEVLGRQATALAADVGPAGFSIGIGSWHTGPSGVPASYAEAREALEVALRSATRERPVMFDEILLEHIVHSSARSQRLLADTLEPLRAYDERRGTELLETLRAYMEAGFNMTRCAAILSVNPNTVVYRLRRVKEITGRDPSRAADLVLLCLGLKLQPSGSGTAARPDAGAADLFPALTGRAAAS